MSWKLHCPRKKDDLRITISDHCNLVNAEHWRSVERGNNLYLSLEYLGALENALGNDIEFRYLIFYSDDLKPVAISAVQLFNFSDSGAKYEEFFTHLGDGLKAKLLKRFDLRVMICGNLFSCGENGFMHTSDITSVQAYDNLSKGLSRLRQAEKTKDNQISFVVLKEFWKESFKNSAVLKSYDYREFMIDVNMVVKINKDWQDFNDYLNDMTSKFRTKAKGAYKKSSSLEMVDMNHEQIIENYDRVEHLHKEVLKNVQYNFGELNVDSFINFKKQLPNQFTFKGYFLKQELVGFSTAFVFNKVVDANYVGIDYKLNQEHAIYSRILYDFVDFAIQNKCTEVRLGRTAEEIKSTVGAEPADMQLFVRHRNQISNQLLKPIVSSIRPSSFELRRPFKSPLLKA